MSDSPEEKNSNEPAPAPIGQQATQGNTAAKMPAALFVLALAAVLALVVFGWVVASQMLNGSDNHSAGFNNGNVPTTNNDQSDQPISILPGEPAGVTLLEKQPEISTQSTIQLAPVAQGADVASGFAMDLGSASSFLELSRRFSMIILDNGPENFQRLEPRAILRETITGLEARLLVGPFDSEAEAGEACAILLLPDELLCRPAIFEGELIARE
jgi:hypothetical protein